MPKTKKQTEKEKANLIVFVSDFIGFLRVFMAFLLRNHCTHNVGDIGGRIADVSEL